jgi:DNA-binding LacI/PurR family transcriptional regulator
MEPQKIEEVIEKLNYYRSQSQRLLKTINTMVSLELITELQLANVEDLIDSVSKNNQKTL